MSVRLEINGRVAEVVLDRPDVLNSLDEGMVAEFHTALDDTARRRPVRARTRRRPRVLGRSRPVHRRAAHRGRGGDPPRRVQPADRPPRRAPRADHRRRARSVPRCGLWHRHGVRPRLLRGEDQDRLPVRQHRRRPRLRRPRRARRPSRPTPRPRADLHRAPDRRQRGGGDGPRQRSRARRRAARACAASPHPSPPDRPARS